MSAVDSLLVWTDTTAASAEAINLGSCPRRSSQDVPFRVLNTSEQYAATDVTVSIDGADATTFVLSEDGRRFTAALDLGTIPSATMTANLYLRRITPANANLGNGDARIVLTASGWTT